MPLLKGPSELPGELLPDTLLNRTQAALYISKRTAGYYTVDSLHHVARTGKGPKYRMWSGRNGGRGRWAVYIVADLDAWIDGFFADPITEPRRLENLAEIVEIDDGPDPLPSAGKQEADGPSPFAPLGHSLHNEGN